MTNDNYTTLSFFARAVVSAPEQIDQFAQALKTGVSGVTAADDRRELQDAIDAAVRAWHDVADGQDLSTDDAKIQALMDAIKKLQSSKKDEAKDAALAFTTATQNRLWAKQRSAAGLSHTERLVSSALPAIADAVG